MSRGGAGSRALLRFPMLRVCCIKLAQARAARTMAEQTRASGTVSRDAPGCCRFVAFASATAAATTATTRHACNCPKRLTLGQHCVMKWPCLLFASPPSSSSSSSSSFPSLLHFGRIQIAFAARLKIGAFYSRFRQEQRNGTHERPPKRATWPGSCRLRWEG